MFTVDLSLPFSALLVIAAGAVGYWARGVDDRGFSGDVDRSTAAMQEFEKRNQKLGADRVES